MLGRGPFAGAQQSVSDQRDPLTQNKVSLKARIQLLRFRVFSLLLLSTLFFCILYFLSDVPTIVNFIDLLCAYKNGPYFLTSFFISKMFAKYFQLTTRLKDVTRGNGCTLFSPFLSVCCPKIYSQFLSSCLRILKLRYKFFQGFEGSKLLLTLKFSAFFRG